MKKIILLIIFSISLLGYCQQPFSQAYTSNQVSSAISSGDSNLSLRDSLPYLEVATLNTRTADFERGAPCSETHPTSTFMDGYVTGAPIFPPQIGAADITVDPDTNFTFDTLNANIWTEDGEQIESISIVIYGDFVGLPDPSNIIDVQPTVVPILQTLVGTTSNGIGDFEVFDVEFDLGGVLLEGNLGVPTTYWISMGITLDGGGNARWEYNDDIGIVGNPLALTFDSGDNWEEFTGEEFVYTYTGDCVSIDLGCGETNQSNGFEAALLSGNGPTNPSQIVATDITIDPNIEFTFNTISANLWASAGAENVASADIVIYGDIGGVPNPDNIIDSQTGVSPSSQTLLGQNGDGTFDIYNVEFDMSSVVLQGQLTNATTYWVSIYMTMGDDGDGLWEISTNSISGNPLAVSPDGGVTWAEVDGSDSVFTVNGDCNLLGISCGELSLSNNFQNALFSSDGPTNPLQIVAADIVVAAETSFVLSTVNANIWTFAGAENVASAEITIYGDNGAIPDPDNIIYSENLVPTSQTFVGQNSEGDSDVYNVDFSLGDGALLVGQESVPTTYWVSIYMTMEDGGDGRWERRIGEAVNNPLSFSSDGGATWDIFVNECIYQFDGFCAPFIVVLDTEAGNNLEGLVFAPNPVEDILTLSNDNLIDNIEVFNILGQRVLGQTVRATDVQLDLSSLQVGTYIMKVSITDNGQIGTYKIIKR